MPSTINASSSGSGGLISTGDASGVLQLQNNGTVFLTSDSGNVAIGSTSPTAGNGQLQVLRSGNDGLTRLFIANTNSGSSALSYALFGNNAYPNGYAGIRATSSTNNTAEFGGAVNGLNIFNNVSNLTLGTGGVTRMSVSDSGVTAIQFAPTQVASANANTLDDYEEGTWSTTLDTPANMTGTGSLSEAQYTKVGRLVTLSGKLTGYSVTSTNTTTYPIINLPFPMISNIMSLTGSVLMLVGSTWSSGTAVDNSSGEATSVALLMAAQTVLATGGATIWFSITYSASS